jgi:ABC-type phosphate transport system auxiliary subunit
MSPLLIPIFALLIPIVAIIANVIIKPMIRLRERRMELEVTMTAEKAAQYAAHNERLEQRVRVLERIVTDRGADLAGEIERLRDERPLN